MTGPLAALSLAAGTPLAAGPTTYTEQAQVTNWPLRLALVAVVLALVAAAWWGMRRGWRRRAAAQGDLPAPEAPPAGFAADLLGEVEGRYLASTRAGDRLDRVVVHGLGVPCPATLAAGTGGLLLRRAGAADVFVPVGDVVDVRADRGIAQAAYERGGVVVVTWRLGGALLDSGFRARRTAEHLAVVEAVRRLAGAGERGGPR